MDTNITILRSTKLKCNTAYIAESIEDQLRRTIAGGEPIEMISTPLYTDRKDGVQPQYDIRTDRFDIAMNAMDAVSRSHTAKREQRIQQLNDKAEGE